MFWDSSAIVPLLVTEPRSPAIERLLAGDDQPVIWWATPVECPSALRAADALQLAAALLWCEEQPHGEGFVTLDERLADAAANEAFTVHQGA